MPGARRANPERRMALREHLREARRRLVLACLGILVGAVVGWIVYDTVFALLQRPMEEVAAERDGLAALNFAGVATAIDMKVKISFFLGILIASPWWLYQFWAFITPGLTRVEKRYAFAFLGSAVPLFLGGAAVAWFMLPRAVSILFEFVPDGSASLIDAQTYLSFVMRFLLAFGFAFLVPVVMVALTFLGIVQARTWLNGWRWAILLSFTFAAVMTPTPDVITMIWVALPVCALYFVAVGICALRGRQVARRASTDPAPASP
ncbi:Sec-independent protein translocase TatC [Paraoerskovia marina]|uniref:Sec-independent protein translocase protein TatC n=1 Tax=Paraoerskovia marina TaxID=545619 RepID=A0A1H1SW52_9CELL|nr:Sec-independent protein translocase TatC [Paraoerskovia marina]